MFKDNNQVLTSGDCSSEFSRSIIAEEVASLEPDGAAVLSSALVEALLLLLS